MSYSNLFVNNNSDAEDCNIAAGIDDDKPKAKKSDGLLTNFPDNHVDQENDDEEGDDEVFVDVENTASWAKNIDAQNVSYCGLDEPADYLSNLSTKSDEDISVENNRDLKSNDSQTDVSVNDLSSVTSDNDTATKWDYQSNGSENGATVNNLAQVEISIISGSGLGIDMQSNDSLAGISVETRGSSAGENTSVENDAGAAFELQSSNSDTGISVQTDISIATRSDENISVGTEQEVCVELQSNDSDTGVSINNSLATRSFEIASLKGDPEAEASLKSDDSKTSMTVNVPRSIGSEDSLGAGINPENGINLLLEECKTETQINDPSRNSADAMFGASDVPLEECRGSISLILQTRRGIDEATCEERNDSEDRLFELVGSSDGSLINKLSNDSTGENLTGQITDPENASELKREDLKINEKSAETVKNIDEQPESNPDIEINLQTDDFKKTTPIVYPTEAGEDINRNPENVQFTWDFNTSSAIKDLPIGKTCENIDGKLQNDLGCIANSQESENQPSIPTINSLSESGKETCGGQLANDSETVSNLKSDIGSNSSESDTILKIVDSPTQMTTKSLDILSTDFEKQHNSKEVHSSKSFGIPQKKSSKNRSACSLVKHNNSVEIIRTQSDENETETDGDDTDDDEDGIGYGFANKSSSSLGKHRDSVELLCGKRFDSGSSMQVQKMSFMNNAVDNFEYENGAAYQSRSGLLKIKDSVEIIGMADEDMDIGDVSIESNSHHSPRSILKINKPRSKESACSNTRLVSWKDATPETELQNNFPDETKQLERKTSVEMKQLENNPPGEMRETCKESAVTIETAKKPAKKPPRPKVGNLIKLFSSTKKISFDETEAIDLAELCEETVVDNKAVAANDQHDSQNEGDSQGIKKTFTFWKKVCEDSFVEEKSEEQLQSSEIDGTESSSSSKDLNIKIIEKPLIVSDNGPVENLSVPKKHHKFVEKFEGNSVVPNPMFKKFPLPVENIFVKDRVSVLERSSNAEQEGLNSPIKSAEVKSMKNQ